MRQIFPSSFFQPLLFCSSSVLMHCCYLSSFSIKLCLMDNIESYRNAGEHGQKRRLIKQWVKPLTELWLNMYYAHRFSTCYWKSLNVIFWDTLLKEFILCLICRRNKMTFSLTQPLHCSIRKSVWNYCVNCNDNNAATNWGKKIYSNFMTSFCVFSPLDGEVYINIFKNLPVVILQANKSV